MTHPNFTIINLWPHEYQCVICDARFTGGQGVAIYEGDIVPDDYTGEWGGAPACERCFWISAGLQARNPGKMIPFNEVLRIAKNDSSQVTHG